MNETFDKITGYWVREQYLDGKWVKIDSCPNWWLFGRLTFRNVLGMWGVEDTIRIRFRKRTTHDF